ncbi:unnamed protein product [Prorocentrum cordatum]|uniref:Uncharacterized protein n=1 Tax=Prorocentrum cordatum TaxID=2364126 RepID=A0ABN9X9T8_9DINO|nr:unnamed protein product [Polarella glacialis]
MPTSLVGRRMTTAEEREVENNKKEEGREEGRRRNAEEDDEEDKEKERRQRILDHGAGSRLRPNIGRQRNNPASAIAVLAATMRRAAEGCQAMACTDTHRTNYGA